MPNPIRLFVFINYFELKSETALALSRHELLNAWIVKGLELIFVKTRVGTHLVRSMRYNCFWLSKKEVSLSETKKFTSVSLWVAFSTASGVSQPRVQQSAASRHF